MEKELQLKLVDILTAIQTATGKAADFTMAQLPDVAQQYVLYGRIESAICVFSLFAAAVFASLICWRAFKKPWYSTYSWDAGKGVRADSNQLVIALSGFVAGLFYAAAVANAATAALVWFAPKVWLLKQLAQLIK